MTPSPARHPSPEDAAMLDELPGLAWLSDETGGPGFFNREWSAFVGGSEEGRDWLDFVHPDDRARVREAWGDAVRAGADFHADFRLRRADGAYRRVSARARRRRDEGAGAFLLLALETTELEARGQAGLRDPPGRGVRMIGSRLDLTERKRTEEALERAEARALDRYAELEQVYRYTPVGLFTVDRELRYRRLNERMAEINGLPVQAHLGKTVDEIVPAIAGYVRDVLKPVLERGEPALEVEIHGPTPKAPGVERDWIGSYFPLRTATGEIVGVVGAVQEVTERKRFERALARSEAKYRSLFLNLTEQVHLWRLERDAAGKLETWRLIDANPAALRAWGKTLEEIEGRKPDEIFGPGAEAFVRPQLEQALREGRPSTTEEHYPRADRYLRATLVPLGEQFFISTTTDVTDLRRAIVRADEANARLRELGRRKDEFLAMLSHELRNPLAPIRNSLYLLDRAPPGSEPARRAQSVIDRQVLHLTRLIDDLLDVTRISRGKILLQPEPLDLGELVRRTADDHREVFERGGIEFVTRIDPAPLRVQGDATRLSQVIGNLLGNAAKFTPRGGRVVLALDREGDQAAIRVEDTGAGIPPELTERLFEPFVQADQTLDRSRGGLGLGLALVKGLAELHGGSASGASAGPGRGATFTVRLPLDASRQPELETSAVARPGHPLRRVLVVEDNVDAAETLRDVIQFDGHEVEVAGSGPEALAKVRAFRPEVVFCDIGLPGMDGYEVARALRADPGQAPPYLVALSGYAAPEDVRRAREAGFDEHLAKPVDLEALERVLADGRPDGGGRPPGEGESLPPPIAAAGPASGAGVRGGR